MSSLIAVQLWGEQMVPEPWPKSELLEPAELAEMLKKAEGSREIICVTFPILYRQKHIPHARLFGPGNKPAALAALRAAVSGLSRSREIVIYCGCCPMKDCPNIRPAYRALKEMGFDSVRVLDLPTNFHKDWVAKGYAVES